MEIQSNNHAVDVDPPVSSVEGGSSSHAVDVDPPASSGEAVDQYPWRWLLNVNHIYKIPDYLANLNPNMYQPRLVSIGPISNETWADTSKGLIRDVFLTKSQTTIAEYHGIFLRAENLVYISNAYTGWTLHRDAEDRRVEDVDDLITDAAERQRVVDMMITDGSFILEILTRGPRTTSNAVPDNHGRPLYTNLTNHDDLPIIKQDMLLLQNQLPFWVLQVLFAGRNQLLANNYIPGNQLRSNAELLDLVIQFYSLPESTSRIELPYLHILDIYRRGLISQDFQRDEPRTEGYEYDETNPYFPSASKLYEAGIPFKKSETGNLNDISFRHGTLRLPPFHITKYTAMTIANLITFERLHGTDSDVGSYMFFLNCLLHNANDVSLLESRGIIERKLHDDEDLVKLFGLIANFFVHPTDEMLPQLYILNRQLKGRRFWRRLNIWRLNLLEKYFNTPWAALSVIAAILVIALTITQTIFAGIQTKYTVLSYVQSQKNTTN